MADVERAFAYVAIDPSGRRVSGRLLAREDGLAFEQLKRDGLSPVRIKPAGPSRTVRAPSALRDRDVAEFLSSLALLLNAGADIRTALQILGAKAERPGVAALCRTLTVEVGGGGALDRALGQALGDERVFIAALVASGEASGDLPGGFQRAASMLEARIKLREQFISVLSYPAFVLLSSLAAIGVILLFVVPSLSSVVTDSGAPPPLVLGVLIGASDVLRSNGVALALGILVLGGGGVLAARLGLFETPLDRVLMGGPLRRTVRALAFGSFAIALGTMLAAGAPMSDALRLATRSVRSKSARLALEAVSRSVRQGQSLPLALERVKGFPSSIGRLASVGEASGALGEMLARAGQLEEEAALRRIEAGAKLLGPLLIVLLGGLIGLLMMSLLSGVSQLGQSALQ